MAVAAAAGEAEGAALRKVGPRCVAGDRDGCCARQRCAIKDANETDGSEVAPEESGAAGAACDAGALPLWGGAPEPPETTSTSIAVGGAGEG